MLEVTILMEIHGFCDTTRLLHKWNIYSWKLVLMRYYFANSDVQF